MAKTPSSLATRRRSLKREDLRDQHPDVVALIEPAMDQEESDDDMLVSIGVVLAGLRDEARQARQASGIEEVWRKCEEAYIGMDDMNRSEFQSGKWAKPTDSSGPATTGRPVVGQASGNRSNIYIRLTARYVDAAYSKLTEILLPADEKAYSFTESPVPELIAAREDKRQVLQDGTGIPLTRPLAAGEAQPAPVAPPAPGGSPPGPPAQPMGPMPQPGQAPPPSQLPAGPPSVPGAPPGVAPPGGPPQGPATVPLTVADLAEENIQMARKKAKKAETQVYDWQVETSYRAENRKVIFDSARLGVGVLKGPVPKVSKKMAYVGGKVVHEEKIIPECVWISPWNAFPDPTCGESFQNGSFFYERDWLSERQLRDLKDLPGYISDQIDKIIVEGPDKVHQKSRENGEQIVTSSKDASRGRYEVWYYHGFLKKSELNCICQQSGYHGDESDTADDEPMPVVATLVNDRVIKAVPAPLKSGKIPYRSMPWSRRTGHWAGIGIAEQVFAAQRMLNAATRSMMNNAGKSAGSQIVIDQMAIRPANGVWEIVPDKFWYKTGESVGSVKDAFELYKIQNTTNELMVIVKYALQVAEESTSIPLITQGQTGPETPETLGAAQIQNSNANQLLRSIGYGYDDHITEPVTVDYYEWYLMDPEIDDGDKGDFNIDAHGSVAMVERAIQDQTIATMGPLVVNPAYGINPKSWAKQMVMSKKLDPADFMYTKEEQAKIDATPPPEDPRVQAAKVTMQGWVAEAQLKATSDDKKTHVTAVVDLHELNMKREIAILQYAHDQKMKLTDVQAELAQTAIKVAAEEKLNQRDTAIDLHKHHNPVPPPLDPNKVLPVVQAPGKAGNGKAASQAP